MAISIGMVLFNKLSNQMTDTVNFSIYSILFLQFPNFEGGDIQLLTFCNRSSLVQVPRFLLGAVKLRQHKQLWVHCALSHAGAR
jgi:hypothetical protein